MNDLLEKLLAEDSEEDFEDVFKSVPDEEAEDRIANASDEQIKDMAHSLLPELNVSESLELYGEYFDVDNLADYLNDSINEYIGEASRLDVEDMIDSMKRIIANR
jgi:hypothetical protein